MFFFFLFASRFLPVAAGERRLGGWDGLGGMRESGGWASPMISFFLISLFSSLSLPYLNSFLLPFTPFFPSFFLSSFIISSPLLSSLFLPLSSSFSSLSPNPQIPKSPKSLKSKNPKQVHTKKGAWQCLVKI